MYYRGGFVSGKFKFDQKKRKNPELVTRFELLCQNVIVLTTAEIFLKGEKTKELSESFKVAFVLHVWHRWLMSAGHKCPVCPI